MMNEQIMECFTLPSALFFFSLLFLLLLFCIVRRITRSIAATLVYLGVCVHAIFFLPCFSRNEGENMADAIGG